MKLNELMNQLPLELYLKIKYKSGFITKEAQLIKDMVASLMFPFESIIYMDGGISYSKHFVNMGVLNEYSDYYIDYIFIVG